MVQPARGLGRGPALSTIPGQLNLPEVVQAARDSAAIIQTEYDGFKRGAVQVRTTAMLISDEMRKLFEAAKKLAEKRRQRGQQPKALPNPLPRPGTSSTFEMLTPSEIERLRRGAIEQRHFGLGEFGPKE